MTPVNPLAVVKQLEVGFCRVSVPLLKDPDCGPSPEEMRKSGSFVCNKCITTSCSRSGSGLDCPSAKMHESAETALVPPVGGRKGIRAFSCRISKPDFLPFRFALACDKPFTAEPKAGDRTDDLILRVRANTKHTSARRKTCGR